MRKSITIASSLEIFLIIFAWDNTRKIQGLLLLLAKKERTVELKISMAYDTGKLPLCSYVSTYSRPMFCVIVGISEEYCFPEHVAKIQA